MSKEMWDQRYAGQEYIYGTRPNRYFQSVLDTLEPGRLLLPAEGEGRNAVYAAERGWTVTAVDQSEAGVKKAMKLAEERNVTFDYHLGDILTFPFSESFFDCLGLIYVHTPGPDRREFHRRVVRSLKPGGTLILEGFSKDQVRYSSGGPTHAAMLFDPDELRGDFRELQILRSDCCVIGLDEGDFHKGDASVVRLVAVNR